MPSATLGSNILFGMKALLAKLFIKSRLPIMDGVMLNRLAGLNLFKPDAEQEKRKGQQ